MSAATVAQALLRARRGQQPIDAAAFGEALRTPEEAYAVQDLVLRGLQGDAPVTAWKSGGPSRTAVPTHAPLPAAGVWASPADARARHGNFRLIEAEIALRLGADVDAARAASLSHDEAASLVDAMAVSIEWVDSRWVQGVQAPALLKLADFQSHGALVLGEWTQFAPRDWSRQRCSVRIGGNAPHEFTGTHSMGDPCWVLPSWLRHATRHGGVLARGTVVTTGTWCGMLGARQGERVGVSFEGVGQADLQY